MRDTHHRLPAECAVSDRADEPLAARAYAEESHPYRTPFQRDRSRIVHSRAFRRLAGKTQVFTHGSSDHARSRLTHTVEVAQLARTVAAELGLNEDLAEALALAHDLGHPPFGHAGERILDLLLREHGLRFDHNLHALRIVEFFERRYVAFRGLNLTLGVREGLVKHSRDYTAVEHPELAPYFLDRQPPLEAQLIDLVDEIAYLTADFDDGFEAGLLDPAHVAAHVPLFARFAAAAKFTHGNTDASLLVSEALKRTLNALVGDLIATTTRNVLEAGATGLDAIRHARMRLAGFSPGMEAERWVAKQYLVEHLYSSHELVSEHARAAQVIESLFRCYLSHPELLPRYSSAIAETGSLPRAVADYLAGMTDSFIAAQYELHKDRC